MAINTAYLGTPGSGNAQSSLATTVLSELSVSGPIASGAASVTGSVTASSISLTAADTGVLLASAATTSAASSGGAQNVSDGQFAIMEFADDTATLVYRSGTTIYAWVASNASSGA